MHLSTDLAQLILKTFMTSSPRWLTTLTAMRPFFGFDLAGYGCRLGYLRQGRRLLLRAVRHGGATAVRMALEQGGLEPLRPVLSEV